MNDRLHFRHTPVNKTKWGHCPICGADTLIPLAPHDSAVHEVYALETWGMHSVTPWAKDIVQDWADGTEPLPSREEWREMVEEWRLTQNTVVTAV